jgi:cobalamin biosynthetic protein CobC
VLQEAGCAVIGGTDLFRLVRNERAGDLHGRLAARKIWVRRFDWAHDLLRFGLPADEPQLQRLVAALTSPTTGR